MELLKFPHVLALFLSVAVVASQTGLCPEEYWKAMLPDTLMPSAIKELLPQSWRQAKPAALTPALDLTDLEQNPTASLYFFEKDLFPGKKLNAQFTASEASAPFVPRHTVDSIPFSSQSLPEIYSRLSVDPKSDQAETIRATIQDCEQSVNSDQKTCATSLESMVDFAISKLGKHVQAVSTDAKESPTRKEYTIVAVKKLPSEQGLLACHSREYAYALFYCHMAVSTVAYKVSMVAADGSKAEAVATCHQDTSKWNTWNLAFRVLKVKPGEGSVCHFQHKGDLVWAAKC